MIRILCAIKGNQTMKNKITESNESHLSRRTAILQTLGVFGTMFAAKTAFAQEAPICPPLPPQLVKVVESEISKNHGHDFLIELSDLVKAGGQALDIQGDSGHPHIIVVTNDQIIALMKGEQVVIVSSKDAGHTHQVTLALVEREVSAAELK